MMMNKGWNRMLALTAALLWLMLLPGSTALAASEGVLAEESFGEIARDGFHIPLPEDNGWLGGEAWGMRGLFAEASRTDEQGRTLTVQAYSQVLDQFVQSDLDANRYYDSLRFENERNVSVASTEIDGFAARLVTFSYDRQDGGFAAHAGILMYARETRLLQIRVYSESERSREHSTPKVKMQDLELLAGKIHFVAEEAPIRHSDVELTIGVEGNIPVVAAGSSLQLKAVFGNEAIVNSAAENNGVTWELLDSDLGLNAAVAAINGRGLLTASKEVEWATEVVIRVTSNEFDTSATRKILVTPAATGITVSPDALSFYAGENRSEIARIRMNLKELVTNETFDMDSITVTASCSPEGEYRTNEQLARRRSTAVSEYFSNVLRTLSDSLRRDRGAIMDLAGIIEEPTTPDIRFIARHEAENWTALDRLVSTDSLLDRSAKASYISLREIPDPDQREVACAWNPITGTCGKAFTPGCGLSVSTFTSPGEGCCRTRS